MSTTETSNDAKKAGGYLKEKFTIGVSRVTGDEISRAIMKSTSHLLKAPNEKHLNRLLSATHGQYSPDAAKMHGDMCQYIVKELEKRSHTRNWIVVLKTMVTYHYIMIKGSDGVRKAMQHNRNLFCMRNIKDVADSPDGAAQKLFIGQYIRYLEERNITQARIDVDLCRIESEDYLTMMKTMGDTILAAAMKQLLSQLDCIANVEFREVSVDNFATMEAYNLLISDGKFLYVILANRMVYMLEKFDDLEFIDKQLWLNIYRRYSDVVHKLAVLFSALSSARRHFSSPIPKLKEFPPSLLTKLEEEVEYSSIPRGTVLSESSLPEPEQFSGILTAAASDFNNATEGGLPSSSPVRVDDISNEGENSPPEADPLAHPFVEAKDEHSLDLIFNSSTPQKSAAQAHSRMNTNTTGGSAVNMNDLFGDTAPHQQVQGSTWGDTASSFQSTNNNAPEVDLFTGRKCNDQQSAWSSNEPKPQQVQINNNFGNMNINVNDHLHHDHSSAFEPLEDDTPPRSAHPKPHISSGTDLFSFNGVREPKEPQVQDPHPQPSAPPLQFDPFQEDTKKSAWGGDQQGATGMYSDTHNMESNPFYSSTDQQQQPIVQQPINKNKDLDDLFS